jgi:CheY-like chemotaxis protein
MVEGLENKPKGRKSMKVLVVDDSEYARLRIGQILREGGHEVTEADSGEAALGLARAIPFEAATVDLLMPGMDGLTLIRRLREQWPVLYIVALSADVQSATRQEVLAAGADRFVAKTDPPKGLLAALAAGPEGLVPLTLSPIQRDAFTEVMNVAMGQAAAAMGTLLNRRVSLVVPEVELMTVEGLAAFFQDELVRVGILVRQRFSGCIGGTAALAFSTGHASLLIRSLADIRGDINRLSLAEQSVLTEIGNIVLNAAIAVLADTCRGRLRVGLPVVALDMEGDEAVRDLAGAPSSAQGAFVLVSRLTIGAMELISYLVLLLPDKDVRELLRRIGV